MGYRGFSYWVVLLSRTIACASLSVENRRGSRALHDLDRVRAVAASNVTLAASGNSLGVTGVVNPVPLPRIVFLLPVAWICNVCHVGVSLRSLFESVRLAGASGIARCHPSYMEAFGFQCGCTWQRVTRQQYSYSFALGIFSCASTRVGGP